MSKHKSITVTLTLVVEVDYQACVDAGCGPEEYADMAIRKALEGADGVVFVDCFDKTSRALSS